MARTQMRFARAARPTRRYDGQVFETHHVSRHDHCSRETLTMTSKRRRKRQARSKPITDAAASNPASESDVSASGPDVSASGPASESDVSESGPASESSPSRVRSVSESSPVDAASEPESVSGPASE